MPPRNAIDARHPTARVGAMKNVAASKGMQWTTVLIRCLFVALLILQIADFHSTLTAVNQSEVNGMLLWFAQWVSPSIALFWIKGLDLILILSMWLVWKGHRGEFDRAWLTCLAVCVLTYFAVVANNYAGR